MHPCSTVMHLLMRCLRGCCRHSRSRLPRRLRQPVSYMKLIFQSLYFNSLTNSELVMDCVLEPVFWIVEVVTRWFGMVNPQSPIPYNNPFIIVLLFIIIIVVKSFLFLSRFLSF